MTAAGAVHVLAALGVAASALAMGRFEAFAAAPLVCLIALQVWAFERRPAHAFPRRSVGLALLLAAYAAAPLLAGRPGWALVMLACALGVALAATRLSLASAEPLPAPLDRRFDWRLAAGVAGDELVRLAVEVNGVVRATPVYAEIAAEARIAADRNAEEGWHARPESAYAIPPPLEKLRRERRRLGALGEVELLRFASEFEPQDPEVRDAYLAVPANRTAQAVVLRHAGEPRPTLIYCHGYGTGMPRLEARLAGARRLHQRLGLDVVLFTLPLHGARAISWQSGEGVLDGHVLWTNAAISQAVWDVRRLAGHLSASGSPSVGAFGVSLGAVVASIFASVDERLACVIAMNTPARLDQIFWRQLPPGESAAARAAGLTPHLLERAWSRHSPLRMRPVVEHARRLVIGGLADRVVEPSQTRELWEHWGRPAVHWFPGTHTLWLGLEATRARIDAHLRETLLAAD